MSNDTLRRLIQISEIETDVFDHFLNVPSKFYQYNKIILAFNFKRKY